MTDRQFRLVLGALLLPSLYFDQSRIVAAVVVLLLFEGVTNWRLPLLVERLRRQTADPCACDIEAGMDVPVRFDIDAERVFRLVAAVVLTASVFLFPDYLWWLGWFFAFAMLGAGISGVCPLLIFLRLTGFR